MTYQELSERVKSPHELYNMLDNNRKYKKVWKHRASSSAVFFANPLHYAIQQGIGVYFGGNEKTILGTAVHEAVDYAYTNPSATRGRAIKALIDKAINEYKNMNESIRASIRIDKLIKRAIKCFKLYHKQLLKKNLKHFVSSEEYLEYTVPLEMLSSSLHAGKIQLTGTFDRLYQDDDGNYILVDLKTSSSKIYATVEKSKEYQDLEAHKGAVLDEINKLKKLVDKFSNAQTKLKKHQDEFLMHQKRYNNAFANKKPVKAIANKINSLRKHIDNWNENLNILNDSIEKLKVLDQKYLDICAKIKPFAKEYAKSIHKAKTEEAKKKYGLQITQYALMYMIVKGIKVSKARIEVLFTKNEREPEIEVYEWNLTQSELAKASFALETIIQTIEAYFEGTPSRLLFKENAFSMFYGSETNDFIDDLWED